MLSKENRLKKKKDFEEVFKKGKGFREDFLFLKIKKNELGVSRIGFVVSKKISRKAVQRNKIKRRLREVMKFYLSKIETGFDIVFLAKPGIGEKDFQEIKEIAQKIFKKAKIFKLQ